MEQQRLAAETGKLERLTVRRGDGEIGDQLTGDHTAELCRHEARSGSTCRRGGRAHADHGHRRTGGFRGGHRGGFAHHRDGLGLSGIWFRLGRHRGEIDFHAGAGEGVIDPEIITGTATGLGLEQLPVAADDEHRGKAGHTVAEIEDRVFPAVFARRIEGHGKRVARSVARDPAIVVLPRIARGDAEQHDALIGVFARDAVEIGHRRLARSAPRGRDIEEDDFAEEVGEAHGFALGVEHGKLRRHRTGHRAFDAGRGRSGDDRHGFLRGQGGDGERSGEQGEEAGEFHKNWMRSDRR